MVCTKNVFVSPSQCVLAMQVSAYQSILLLCTAPADLCNSTGIRYVYFPEQMTFDDAKAKCDQLGRGWTMAVPRTPKENQCVYEKKVKYELAGQRGNVWLGFFRQQRDFYQSVDGQSMGFTFWAPYHPFRIARRTCALMWGASPIRGRWKDSHCSVHSRSERIPVMCQQCKLHRIITL